MSGRHFEVWLRATALRLTCCAALALGTMVLLTYAVLPAAADCTASPAGLIGWWPGDGNANDIAGTNHGTLQGGATTTNTYMIGQAFSFNGTSAFVQIPNAASQKPTNLTIECFVLFTSLNSTGNGAPVGEQYLVFKQNSRSSNFEGYDLGKTRVGTNDVFRFNVSSASGQTVSVQSSTVISTGVWYHVAAVRGSNFIQLYVNNILERQTNVTFAQDYGNFPLCFGTSGQAYWDRKFSGMMEEVTLYNRALSAAEISSIYYAYGWGKCKAPGITANPQSATLPIGANVTFSAAANGLGALSYQWRSNGVAIPGATNTTLALSNLQLTASADYSVAVTNALGSTESAAAQLYVYPPPSVIVNVDIGDGPFGTKTGPAALGQETNDFWNHLLGGGTVVDAKTAKGNTTPASVGVPYGMNNWLIPSAASGDPMRDDYLGWTGGISPVTISGLPSGIYDFYLYSHDSYFQLSVGNTNHGNKLAFENFPLASPPVWTEGRQFVSFHNVAVTNGGSPVSIGVGHFLQQDGIIAGLQIVRNAPWILQQPSNAIVAVSNALTLQVVSESSPGTTHQWFFNNTPLPDGGRVSGATSSSLVISNAQLTDARDYFVVVTSPGGSVTSLVATVQAGFSPAMLVSPVSQTNLAGTNVQFTAEFSGDAPLGYRWLFNGNPLSDDARHGGTTTTNLTITGLVEVDEGNYALLASNLFGVTTSAVATLTVLSPPSITVQPANQYLAAGKTATFSVTAAGDTPLNYQWRFDGALLTDDAHVSGASSPTLTVSNVQSGDVGGYTVIVSNTWGVVTSSIATLTLSTVRFVNVSNAMPASPFTNWATAATTIQDAINGSGPDDVIWVTNGVYQSGGVWPGGTFVPNRIALNKPVTVISVNGPAVTRILGNEATGFTYSAFGRRCAYVTNGAMLSGFTLSAGRADFHDTNINDQKGGGVLCASPSAVVSNCVITGNFAGRTGGGAYSGTLINCVLKDNQSVNLYIGGIGEGGGAYASDLRNCLVSSNRANVQGGGAHLGTLVNCTVVGNSATSGGGISACFVTNSVVQINTGNTPLLANHLTATFDTSCTTPDPGGSGNITNEPAFANPTGANFHLQSGSPCINAGSTAAAVGSVDVDGLPRVVDGLVDMGAYEFQHAPFILVSPVSQSVLLTSNVAFTVYALGDEPLSYQWVKDGANVIDGTRIVGANTATLTISNLNLADAGGYSILVTNTSGSATSAVATLTLLGLPTISIQPVSRTVPAATNVSFSVTASGLAALSYQWRFSQTGLAGKTNATLSLTNVQSVNAGDYDVVISNIYGAITSTVATLTVTPAAPTLTTQAVSRVASVGQNVPFTVAAKGSEPMTCQWQWNGTNLPGANAFALTLSNVNSSFNGTYRAVVSNDFGFAFSTNVTLVVSPVLIWGLTNNPQLLVNAAIPATVTNVIAIAAAGSTDLGLPCMALRADGSLATWGYSSRDPAPPTNAVDLVAISVGSTGGSANNLVLRADGTVVHWTSSTKPPQPAAITNGQIVAVAAGGAHQLALRDDGTVIAWGSNTSGQTNVPPGATNIIAIATGASHSLALRADGTVVGWGLNTSGQALSNAVNVVAIAAGGQQSLALLADGTVVGRVVTNTPTVAVYYGPPVGNTTNKIAIAAGSTHSLAVGLDRTINGWGATNFGQLNVPAYATNVLAIAAGGNNSLALVPDPFAPPIPPRIGRPPLGRALKTGDNIVLNALGIGGLPLHYQWLRDGAPVAGKTNQWLALTSAHPSEAGDYQLLVVNDFGSATSAVATVTVSIPQPMLLSPGTVMNGFRFSFTSVLGVIYVVEYKDNLSADAWTELERRFGVGGLEMVTDTSANGLMRFYRVRALYAPSPKLGVATWSGGAVNFSFPGVSGAVYVTQYKEQLGDPVWLELSRQTGTGIPVVVNDPNPPGPSRFYRVRVE